MAARAIFQITEEDLEWSSTLEPGDVGLWCWIESGCYQGFCDSREKAEERYAASR